MKSKKSIGKKYQPASHRTPESGATFLAIVGNIFLFIIKIIAGLLYNSISLISDALNSLTDIMASLAIHISLKISKHAPDKRHQFGHTRAQPIGGLIVSIFTIVVGYEVIINSISRILSDEQIIIGTFPLFVVFLVFITKLFLYMHTKKIYRSTQSIALKANMVDHKNDMLISIAVFLGLFVSNIGYPIADPVIAIIVGLYIIRSGWDIGKENVDYLMGVAPTEKTFSKIESLATSTKGVLGINDLRAHMLGSHVEVEVHIYVDKNMNINKAHDIGKDVQKKIESLKNIQRAFVHIDPFLGKFNRKRKF